MNLCWWLRDVTHWPHSQEPLRSFFLWRHSRENGKIRYFEHEITNENRGLAHLWGPTVAESDKNFLCYFSAEDSSTLLMVKSSLKPQRYDSCVVMFEDPLSGRKIQSGRGSISLLVLLLVWPGWRWGLSRASG